MYTSCFWKQDWHIVEIDTGPMAHRTFLSNEIQLPMSSSMCIHLVSAIHANWMPGHCTYALVLAALKRFLSIGESRSHK